MISSSSLAQFQLVKLSLKPSLLLPLHNLSDRMTCMSCKLGYPINPKRVVAFSKISALKCGQDEKMTDRGLQGIAGFTGVTGGYRGF